MYVDYVESTNINNSMKNKYKKWYESITENAKTRIIDGYTETHHILPRSMGGDDSIENRVELTAREHFICHWLLTKMTSGDDHYKMLNALRIMRAGSPKHQRYQTKITARVYENLKTEYAHLQSERVSGENNPMYGKTWTEEIKIAHSKKIKGRIQPPEEKERQRRAQTGKPRGPFTNEWIENLSKNHKSKQPGFNGKLSENTKQKIGDALRGRKQDLETIKKKADAVRGSKREKKLCPYCNQLVAVNGYARWHGDNCKHK